MAIDASAVGVKGEPSRRSWSSKDALLYAVGIGAGLDDLKFTTENTKDTEQNDRGNAPSCQSGTMRICSHVM